MSHSCEDEHHDHHGHGHNHTAPIPTNAEQSLYSFIDTAKIICLNAVAPTVPGQWESYKGFLKDRESRFNCGYYLESDADCQMVVHIPFTGNCRLFSIILRTSGNDLGAGLSTPKSIKVYRNFNRNIDFDTLDSSKEDLKIEHPEDVGLKDCEETENDDESTFVEHQLPRRIFQNCSSVTLFIEDNWSGDEDQLSRLYYLEIRGEFSGQKVLNNGVPMMNVYEAAPNPVDHQKLEAEQDELGLGR